jgi:hypothetical protein
MLFLILKIKMSNEDWRQFRFNNKNYRITNEVWPSHSYFFLKQELRFQTRDDICYARQINKIRHCVPYRYQFYDFTIGKLFDSLEEWALSAGGTLDDIMYGSAHVHKARPLVYIPLSSLVA